MPDEPIMRFVVDAEAPTEARSALPLSQVSAIAHQSVEISREAVRNGCSAALQNVMDVLSTLPTMTDQAHVTEVKFSLTINAGGEVSIMSLAKGHLSGSTGFEFTICLGAAQHAANE